MPGVIFQDPSFFFRSEPAKYNFLPFRFMEFDGKQILVNEVGEHCFLDHPTFDAFVSKSLPTWIVKLRNHLKGLTGIGSDPFHPWLRERCYASRFAITCDLKAVTSMIESDPKDEMEESFNEESSRFTRRTGAR